MYSVIVRLVDRRTKGIKNIPTYSEARKIAYDNLSINSEVRQVSVFDTDTKTMIENIVRSFPESR